MRSTVVSPLPAKPAMDAFYKVIEDRALWSENMVGVMYRSLKAAFDATTGPQPQDDAIRARLETATNEAQLVA